MPASAAPEVMSAHDDASSWSVRLATWSLLAALLSGLAAWWVVRHGVRFIPPDSWVYWGAAWSLAEGRGYVDASGQPVVYWPPGYPLFLAPWVAAFGPTGHALALASAALAMVQGGAWTAYALWFSQGVPGSRADRRVGQLAAVAFVVGFVASTGVALLSENLSLALLPPTVVLAVGAARTVGVASVRAWALVGLLLAAQLAVRNASIAFVVAAGVVCLVSSRPWRERIVAATVLGVTSLGPWLALRAWLGQLSSHRFGAAARPFRSIIREAVGGLGETLVLVEAGVVLWAVALVVVFVMRRSINRVLGRESRLRWSMALVFAGASFVALVASFSLTWVGGTLDGRFLWFVPLLVVPPAIAWSPTMPRWIALGLLLLVSAPWARLVLLAQDFAEKGAARTAENARLHVRRGEMISVEDATRFGVPDWPVER